MRCPERRRGDGAMDALCHRCWKPPLTACVCADVFSRDLLQKEAGKPGEGEPDPASVGLAGRRNLQSLSASEAIVDALEMAAAEAARLEEHRRDKQVRCFTRVPVWVWVVGRGCCGVGLGSPLLWLGEEPNTIVARRPAGERQQNTL